MKFNWFVNQEPVSYGCSRCSICQELIRGAFKIIIGRDGGGVGLNPHQVALETAIRTLIIFKLENQSLTKCGRSILSKNCPKMYIKIYIFSSVQSNSTLISLGILKCHSGAKKMIYFFS